MRTQLRMKNSLIKELSHIYRYFNLLYPRLRNLVVSQYNNLTNLSFLVFAQVVLAGIGFLTQVAIANTVGKQTLGIIAYATTVGIFGQVVVRFGLDRTLVRDLVHWPERFSVVVKSSMILRYGMCAIVLFSLIVWEVITPGQCFTLGQFLIICAISLISLDLQPVYDVWGKMKRQAIYMLMQKVAYLLAIWFIILIAPKALSPLSIGIAMLSTTLLYLIIQHIWATYQIHNNYECQRTTLQDILRLFKTNFLIWISALGGMIVFYLNQIVLKHYIGYEELGGYAASWQIFMAGVMFLEQLSRIGRPAIARNTLPEIDYKRQIWFLTKYLSVMLAAALPASFVMIAFPGHIVRLLFKPEYASSAHLLPIFGFSLMVEAVSYVVSQYVLSTRMNGMYLLANVVTGLVSVGLCLLLIPRFGGSGAAWSVFLSIVCIVIFYSMATTKAMEAHS
jgi:O-antigen/teichoic acid export membrane protein